jgi:DNA repair protein RecO (recombination protein O)
MNGERLEKSMSKTYRVTGVNLKSIPLGESDRLLTILTPEQGLIKAIAPKCRQYRSQLRGRTELFVVNDLTLVKGRSLDKITQAETIISYNNLSNNLGKLTSGQYLAELTLAIALSEQPQLEIYQLITKHLAKLEEINPTESCLPYLTQAIFDFLTVAGIAPRVNACCITQRRLKPRSQGENWQVGFSCEAGGIINLGIPSSIKIDNHLGALELTLLQQLSTQSLSSVNVGDPTWVNIERILRNYTQYHLGRQIRSATLLDNLNSVLTR